MRKQDENKYTDFSNVEKMKKSHVPEEFPEGAYSFPGRSPQEKQTKSEDQWKSLSSKNKRS